MKTAMLASILFDELGASRASAQRHAQWASLTGQSTRFFASAVTEETVTAASRAGGGRMARDATMASAVRRSGAASDVRGPR
jgi:hypothetical protein